MHLLVTPVAPGSWSQRRLALAVPVLLCALPSGCRPPRPAAAPLVAPAPITITLLSTNDLHGQLEPSLRYTESARPYRVGGAEALAATIAELRALNPEGTVLLDAGDASQGTLLSNRYEGAPVRELFSILGYDAVAVGNHEFDYGAVGVGDPPPGATDDPQGALRAWARGAPFAVLSANLTDEKNGALGWDNLRPSVVLERRGIRIGVIGLTTTESAVTTMPSLVRHLRFHPMREAVRREARRLRAAGVGIVVALAHVEGSCESAAPASCRGELVDGLLAGLEPGLLDAVVAGHSHTIISHEIAGIPVIEACSKGAAVGRLELSVDPRSGRAIPGRTRLYPLTPVCHDLFESTGSCFETETESPVRRSPLLGRHRQLVDRVRASVARYQTQLRRESGRVLARLERPLQGRSCQPSETGTLFTNALLRSVPGADLALLNAGAIRTELPAGEITYQDLYQAFPFENRVASVALDADQVTELVSRVARRNGANLLLAGLRARLSCRGAAPQVTLKDSEGRPLARGRLYTVVVTDFLLAGGDGMGPFFDKLPSARKQIYGDKLFRDVLMSYLLQRQGPLVKAADPVLPERSLEVEASCPCPRAKRGRRSLCP